MCFFALLSKINGLSTNNLTSDELTTSHIVNIKDPTLLRNFKKQQ